MIYWEKNTGDNTVDPKNRIAVLCNADFTPCHIALDHRSLDIEIKVFVFTI